MEDEVALSALKREALTLYDNLRDLEQRRDELEEEEKHRGTPAQERERLLEQVGTSLLDNAPNKYLSSLGRYPKVGHNRPLTLPEPEPTLPFDLPLSEPTYLHRPYLFDLFGLSKC